MNNECLTSACTTSTYADSYFFVPSATFLASTYGAHADECKNVIFCLSDIYRFDETVGRLFATSTPFIRLLVDIGTDPVVQIRNSFFLGCHLIMSHGLGFEEAFLSLRSLHELFDRFYQESNISVEKSLRAFCCAKCLNWIDFRISTGNDIQIDRFVHDARWCAIFPSSLAVIANSVRLHTDTRWRQKRDRLDFHCGS